MDIIELKQSSMKFGTHASKQILKKNLVNRKRAACLANLQGSVGLILAKASGMRVTIPIDLSTRPFIPLPRLVSFALVVHPLFLRLP